MNCHSRLVSTFVLSCACAPLIASEALPEIDFGLRTRWETAKFAEEKAHALTVKARVNIEERLTDQFAAIIQVDHVATLNDAKHSDGVLQTSKPTIADPQGTEINQANLEYEWNETHFTFGRQHIAYSDERLIGGVEFRQNDQTYDALQIEHLILSGSKVSVAYIHNVNRIFGDSADKNLDKDDIRFNTLNGVRPKALLGDHHIDGWLLHSHLKEWDYFELDAYGYSVHNYHVRSFSNRTLGIEGRYKRKIGKVKIASAAELAYQKQPSQNSEWIGYRKLSASIEMYGLSLGGRHELLTENKGNAFITPLATLHRFQGWADQFLVTPNIGLEDNSVNIKWRARPWTIDARYHWFSSDTGNFEFGEELNVDLIFQPKRKHQVKLRYADFNHDPEQTLKPIDVRKVFLMYSYNL